MYLIAKAIERFGAQTLPFASESGVKLQKRVESSQMIHFCLAKSYDDRSLFDEGSSEEVEWVLEELWYSTGEKVEMEGRYYGCGIKDKDWFQIDFYTFQQWGSRSGQSDGSPRLSDSSSAASGKGSRLWTEAALEIDSWCQSHTYKQIYV